MDNYHLSECDAAAQDFPLTPSTLFVFVAGAESATWHSQMKLRVIHLNQAVFARDKPELLSPNWHVYHIACHHVKLCTSQPVRQSVSQGF